MRPIPQQALDIIKHFEGIKLTPYFCSANKKTIGVGHVILPHENFEKITMEQAEELLRKDLSIAARSIRRNVRVALNDNQYSALLSFIFNVGTGAFQASTLLRFLNRGQYESAADQFLRWDKVNGQRVQGLTRRRISERNLFLKET